MGIKISVKIGMLQRGDKLSLKSLITFHQLEHTYDRVFLSKYLEELENSLKNLVRPHLSEKSVERVEQIFGVLKTAEFLDTLYQPNYPEIRMLMERVVQDLTSCLEAGTI